MAVDFKKLTTVVSLVQLEQRLGESEIDKREFMSRFKMDDGESVNYMNFGLTVTELQENYVK